MMICRNPEWFWWSGEMARKSIQCNFTWRFGMFRVLAGGLILLISMASGFSEDKISTSPWPVQFWGSGPPTNGELDSAHTTILGVTIGVHTLEDVMNEFGETTIFRSNSNITYCPSLICYMSCAASDETSIVFEAGPLGGWETITAFVVGRKTDIPFYKDRCTKSSRVMKKITTRSGIRLGMDKDEFTDILGKSTDCEGDRVAYHFLCERKMTEKEIKSLQLRQEEIFGREKKISPFYDISSGMEARFSGERLVWFRVYWMKST
jgi:hypothetical protein